MPEHDFTYYHRRASEMLLDMAINGSCDDPERVVAQVELVTETEKNAVSLAVNDLQRQLARGLLDTAQMIRRQFQECS